MKIITVILSVMVTGILSHLHRDKMWPPKELLKFIEPLHDPCVNETGVKNEDIIEFSEGVTYENENLKCYMNCLFQKAQVVDDDGEINFEKLYEKMNYLIEDDRLMNMAIKMASECMTPIGDTLCEKAFWIHKCWKTVDPSHYFLI